MKKLVTLLLSFALLASLLHFSISAAEDVDTYDARYVSYRVQSAVGINRVEYIFRYNLCTLAPTFGKNCDSIEEVLEQCAKAAEGDEVYVFKNRYDQKMYFAVAHKVGVYIAEEKDSYFSGIYYGRSADKPIQELREGYAIKTISPDIQIQSVYYFDKIPGNGAAIYYKTDLGDFVYYYIGHREWLFTGEAFFAYMKALYEANVDAFEIKDKYIPITYNVWNLETYDFYSPNFNPYAPLPIEKDEPDFLWLIVGIGAVVLVAAAVTTVLLIRRKKKKTEPEEMELTPEET